MRVLLLRSYFFIVSNNEKVYYDFQEVLENHSKRWCLRFYLHCAIAIDCDRAIHSLRVQPKTRVFKKFYDLE